MERSVTGIVVLSPEEELNTIEPAASPGEDGVVSCTVIAALWPAASVTFDGETEPNEVNCAVATRHGTTPLVPPSAATSPKMTPVQVPAVGAVTSTFPKLPTPCGSE